MVHLAEKGRGRALKRVWSASDSDVLVYMDVDLSTDLAALLPLVAPLVSGHSDLAIGSRLSRHSRVTRGMKRELISRSYNLILRRTLRARFSDAQCGFKAVRRDAARELLPLVEDNAWFFDTELLVVAERAGLRIHEVPVDWVDDPDSSVDIVRTAVDDLKGVARLGRALVQGHPAPARDRRAARAHQHGGAARPARHAGRRLPGDRGRARRWPTPLLFLALRSVDRPRCGPTSSRCWSPPSRTPRPTGASPSGCAVRATPYATRCRGSSLFAAGLAATTGSLALLHATGSTNRALEVTVLTVANLAVTVLRFVAMKLWVFVRSDSRGRSVRQADLEQHTRRLPGLEDPRQRAGQQHRGARRG